MTGAFASDFFIVMLEDGKAPFRLLDLLSRGSVERGEELRERNLIEDLEFEGGEEVGKGPVAFVLRYGRD